ncbi:MAG: hypothetical protein J6K41_07660 [Paraprevotella sp.]|nr:hypothetical protein [Paraprevotella sp.]
MGTRLTTSADVGRTMSGEISLTRSSTPPYRYGIRMKIKGHPENQPLMDDR